MARAHYVRYVTDEEGRPIAGATVEVRVQGTVTLISDVMHDADVGGNVLANPFTGRSDGKVEFYIDAPQRVDLHITKTGYNPLDFTADVIVLTASTLVLQDEGVNLTQRAKINFTGDTVVASDAGAGPNATTVAINHPATTVHSVDQPPAAHTIGGAKHTGSLAAGQHGDRSAEVATLHAHSQLNGVGATDHHAAPVAGPDADITVDVAGAAGTAGAFARNLHGHKVATSATTPTRVQKRASAAPGATGGLARPDHVHRGTVEATNATTGGPSAGTAQVSLLNAVYTIPANTAAVGQTYRIRVTGVHDVANGASPMVIRLKIGGTVIRTFSINVTVPAATPFTLEAMLRFETPGAGGIVRSTLIQLGTNFSDAGTGSTAIDTTADRDIDITAQPGTNGDTYRAVTATVELLEP